MYIFLVKIQEYAPIFKLGKQVLKLINRKKTNAYFLIIVKCEGGHFFIKMHLSALKGPHSFVKTLLSALKGGHFLTKTPLFAIKGPHFFEKTAPSAIKEPHFFIQLMLSACGEIRSCIKTLPFNYRNMCFCSVIFA